MKALVTGASSGLGKHMAILLSQKGYDIIAVARRQEELEKLKQVVDTNLQIIPMDLSKKENCIQLYERVKNEEIDVFINNAGFGNFGNFREIDLQKDIDLIQTNIVGMHILLKLFLKDMVKKDRGRILNVASIAGFMPGPKMSVYYASKAYVLRLTQGIQKELSKEKLKVKVSVLCPGPVKTNFNQTAGVEFAIGGLDSKDVAQYAIKKMFQNKKIIIPGLGIKVLKQLTRLAPESLVTEISYHVQMGKKKKK